MARRDDEDEHRDGDVDVEDQAPRARRQQVAADEGAGRGGDPAQAGPRADRPRPVGGPERRLDDGEAAGRQECPADPLDDAGHDEEGGIRRDAAERGGDGEPGDADGEHAPTPEAVAQRPAEQQEGGQREGVAGDDPLERADAAAEGPVDGGECDADHGRIEEGDAGAEDGGSQDPAPTGRVERDVQIGVDRGWGTRSRRADAGRRHCGQWRMSKPITVPARTTVPAGVPWLRTRAVATAVDVVVVPVVEVVAAEVVVVVVLGGRVEKQAHSSPAEWSSCTARANLRPVTSGTGLPSG